MSEITNIAFGNIANALKSVASDHVLAIAEDIYDVSLKKYQSTINASILTKDNAAKTYLPLAGGTMTGTINSNNILPTTNLTYNLGSSAISYNKTYTRYIDTLSGYDLRFMAGGTEHIRIQASDGSLLPISTGTKNIGSSDLKFKNIYGNNIYGTTIYENGTSLASKYATPTYVNNKIAELVDSAPSALNTLNELAAALGDDANFSTTITNLIGTKTTGPSASTSENIAIFNGTSGKELKDSGKKISDFSLAGHTHDNRYYTESEANSRFVNVSGDTMTGALTMNAGTGLQMKYTSGGSDPWIYPNGASNYGIRYFEGTPDKMALSASGNNDSTSGADLCINGNGDGTVTVRGNTICHAGNSSVSGGGSSWGSSITVNINGTSKTLTIPGNPNTNTWRALQVNGTQIASTSTSSYAVNFKSGTGITVSGAAGSSSAANAVTITNSGVRATTINGNYLRVNTNGTNADLTIPYASSAGSSTYASRLGNSSAYYTKSSLDTALAGKAATSHGTHLSGSAALYSNSNQGSDCNSITYNLIGYYTSNGPATSLGATTNDGTLYSQAYSSSWVSQIAQDYRNGNLFTRGKNSGTWTAWKAVSYSGHTHLYAGSSTAGGAATSANKLNTNAGSATNPVYFSGGIPVACTYSLNKTVPSNAVFTDTTYSAGTGLSLSGTTFSVKYGSTAGTACQGNDSRLSDARPASDVYAWAKAATKPTYTYSEVGAAASSHSHSSYVNQNAFSNVTVGTTTIAADSTTDTLTLVAGSNVTITPDATNDKITISSSYTNTDTKNTTGSTNTSDKIFLVGATSQAANPQTYSHDTAFVGTDGCLYSGSTKVKTVQTAVSDPKASGTSTAFIDTISQNANGVITATKKSLPTASTTVAGITKVGATGGAAAYSHTHSYQPVGNYKTTQTAVSDPRASGTSTTFIDSISQNANGVITVTKKSLPTSSSSGVFYGVCSIAAGTITKVATVEESGFELVHGAKVVVDFIYENTSVSPTLNINNTGAKYIKFGDGTNVGYIPVGPQLFVFNAEDDEWRCASVPTFISSAYGTSSNDASTTAKTVTVLTGFNRFRLVNGVTINVQFTKANTANKSLTLNVNGTGAKPIYYLGTNYGATTVRTRYLTWDANSVVQFVYSGTYWIAVNNVRISSSTS